MARNDFSKTNKKKVRDWYLGIKKIFNHIQEKNNWSKKVTWDRLEIELRKSVEKESFVSDDLEWVKNILFYDKKPSIDEVMRVSQRYTDRTPLIDSLKKLL